MLEAITLDFYGTLVHDDAPHFKTVCDSVAASARVGAPSSQDIAAAWLAAWEQACEAAIGDDFKPLRTLCRSALTGVLRDVGSAQDADELLAPQFNYWRQPKLFPDTQEFLAATELPICIISDVDREDLVAALTHIGVGFDHVITSEDARAYKPHPQPFRLALASLSISATAGLHIGDSLASDITGARNCGMHAAWVNRHGKHCHHDAQVIQCSSLAELRILLAG